MSGPRLATAFSMLCDLGRSLSPLLTTMAPSGQAGLSIDSTRARLAWATASDTDQMRALLGGYPLPMGVLLSGLR